MNRQGKTSAIALLILTVMGGILGVLGYQTFFATQEIIVSGGEGSAVTDCNTAPSFKLFANDKLDPATTPTLNYRIQEEGIDEWTDVSTDTDGYDFSTSKSVTAITAGENYRAMIYLDNGSSNDYYMEVSEIILGTCGAENIKLKPYAEGNLDLKILEEEGDTINDGIVPRGEGQAFTAEIQFEENVTDAVFGDGVTPIAIALDYNVSSFNDVYVIGGDKIEVPDFLSSYERMYALDFNRVENLERSTVRVRAEPKTDKNPDGEYYNVTIRFIDGNGYINSDTLQLERGYEDDTGSDIGNTGTTSINLILT